MSQKFFQQQLAEQELWKSDDDIEWNSTANLNLKYPSNINTFKPNINAPIANPSSYSILKQEYDKLIETNHSLAEQYGRCQTEKDKLSHENTELKQSLKECELMLTKKMKSDNETWTEMETVHYELKEMLNNTQSELQKYKSLSESQVSQIRRLDNLLNGQNERSTTSKQTENRLRDEIKMQKAEIASLKSSLSKSQEIIHGKQSQINKLSKLQSPTQKRKHRQKQKQKIPMVSPINSNKLDGTLGATLKILHNELYESLQPQQYLLWKKWVYALMQHFENKLNALNTNQYHDNYDDIAQSIQQLDDIYSNVQNSPLRTYNEPRVIVKYKKKRKRTKSGNNAVKTQRMKIGVRSPMSPKKRPKNRYTRSQTMAKSATKPTLSGSRKNGYRQVKSMKRLPSFRF